MPLIRTSLLFSFICLLLFSCGKKNASSGAGSGGGKSGMPVSVIGYVVTPGKIYEQLELPGHLLPSEATEIHAEMPGIIRTLNMPEGVFVQAGTLLAKLNDDELQAQLKKLKIQLEIAEKTEARNKELLGLNAISQQDYDLSYLQVNNLRADIEYLRTQIQKTEIRAPFSGKLGFRKVSPGAYVTPATPLTSIRQVQTLKLEFSVPDKYAAGIKAGDEITFHVQGSPTTFPAKVYATDSYVNDQTKGMIVRCMVTYQDPELVAGAYASIKFDLSDNNKAVLIPSKAIIPQARGKKVIIYRNGQALMTDVQTGLRDSSRVEILKGLNAGDTILLTGLMTVKQGQSLKLTKVE